VQFLLASRGDVSDFNKSAHAPVHAQTQEPTLTTGHTKTFNTPEKASQNMLETHVTPTATLQY